jgi:hypothetical protein
MNKNFTLIWIFWSDETMTFCTTETFNGSMNKWISTGSFRTRIAKEDTKIKLETLSNFCKSKQ